MRKFFNFSSHSVFTAPLLVSSQRSQSHALLMQLAKRSEGICLGLTSTIAQHHLFNELVIAEQTLNDIKNLAPEQEPNEFIKNFIELIRQHQDPRNYTHLFIYNNTPLLYQNPAITMRMTPSHLQAKQIDHPITKVAEFSGVYTGAELNIALNALKKVFENYQQPVSTIISNSNHAIFVGYEKNKISKKSRWIFADANFLPIKYIENTDDLTGLIALGLKGLGHPIIIRTLIFAATDAPNLQALLSDRFLTPEWKKIHCITEEKTAKRDAQKASWLHLAAKSDDVNTLRKVIAKTDEIDLRDNANNTPLTYAMHYRLNENATLLLANGADPDCQTSTTLEKSFHQNEKIRALILQKQIEKRLLLQHGISWDSFAAKKERHEAIQKLLPILLQNHNAEQKTKVASAFKKWDDAIQAVFTMAILSYELTEKDEAKIKQFYGSLFDAKPKKRLFENPSDFIHNILDSY